MSFKLATSQTINIRDGLTPTERLLKQLGERSFLRFWSHANPHITPQQELCDLLVICGDTVVIFSDKSCDYQFGCNRSVAWHRWFRNAIAKSARQLDGATRHLFDLSNPVYKDKDCTVPLGIPIPSVDTAKVHRVAVVSRSRALDEGIMPAPFLRLDSSIVGDQHTDRAADEFAIGDVAPSSRFVHVFDFTGLHAALMQMDTITDFSLYLEERARFLRGAPSNVAANEFCMVTRYTFSFDDEGHPLPLDLHKPGRTYLDNNEWQADEAKAALRARKSANQDSYLWDFLVDQQIEMYENQTYAFAGITSLAQAERLARQFALETRLNRRILSKAWKEACLIAEPGRPANLRTVHSGLGSDTTYVFFTLEQRPEIGHVDYRLRRRDLLRNMAHAALIDVPESKVIVGIASELGQPPDSYDIMALHVDLEPDFAALMHDARQCWEFKKTVFEDPRPGRLDEGDFPAAV